MVASALVAGAAAMYLAVRLAPRYDEFHTLAHLQDGDLGSLWRSYRDVHDTLPPVAYGSWWVWSRATGTSLLAARMLSVVSWTVAAAAVTGLTRRAGAWASFGAGLLASATSLVFLGPFARPYAPALACLAVAVWCWQRAGATRRPAPLLVASGLLFAAAAAVHYATAAVAVIVAVVALVDRDGSRRPWGRVAAPAVGGLLPVLLSAALLPQAIEDQGRLRQAVGPADALLFWPSALRPAVPALAAAGLLVAAAWCWPGADRSVVRRRLLDRDVARAGWALAIVVPLVTVAAMAATSGTYVHRYSIGALLGGAIVLAEVLGRAGRRWSWVGPVAAALLMVAVGLALRSTTRQMTSEAHIERLAAAVGRSTSADELVALDEYDYLLVRHGADPVVAERLRLGEAPSVAHSPEPVDVAARVDDPRGEPVEVIGTRAAIAELVRRSDGWEATVRTVVSYPRPGGTQTLVVATLAPG